MERSSGPWEAVKDIPSLETWVAARLQTLGVAHGDDVSLLSAGDLLADALPEETRIWLEREFPERLQLGNGEYEISYDFKNLEAVFNRVAGNQKNPPPLATLPAVRGFKIKVKHHSRVWVLRDRG